MNVEWIQECLLKVLSVSTACIQSSAANTDETSNVYHKVFLYGSSEAPLIRKKRISLTLKWKRAASAWLGWKRMALYERGNRAYLPPLCPCRDTDTNCYVVMYIMTAWHMIEKMYDRYKHTNWQHHPSISYKSGIKHLSRLGKKTSWKLCVWSVSQ